MATAAPASLSQPDVYLWEQYSWVALNSFDYQVASGILCLFDFLNKLWWKLENSKEYCIFSFCFMFDLAVVCHGNAVRSTYSPRYYPTFAIHSFQYLTDKLFWFVKALLRIESSVPKEEKEARANKVIHEVCRLAIKQNLDLSNYFGIFEWSYIFVVPFQFQTSFSIDATSI